jgi:hypothetical protein
MKSIRRLHLTFNPAGDFQNSSLYSSRRSIPIKSLLLILLMTGRPERLIIIKPVLKDPLGPCVSNLIQNLSQPHQYLLYFSQLIREILCI